MGNLIEAPAFDAPQYTLDSGYCTVASFQSPYRNAHLIAAAPELYEALTEAVLQIEYLHGKFQPTGSGEAVLARSKIALSKARGEQ